ncbi:MAG: LytR family transcriptional regulator [Propionibacteriales bacterium]|nr:LytR family transcriptional regulator [Propionibacteriales bacterium]
MGVTAASESMQERPSPHVRRRRIKLHRARTVWGAIAMTTVCAFLPGSGFVVAGRRQLGLWVLLPHLLVAAVGLWWVATHTRDVLRLAVDPDRLLFAATVLLVLLLAWVVVLIATYRMLRPEEPPRWERMLGGAWVVVLCLIVAAPLVVGARYAMVQRDFINSVFGDSRSATRPAADAADPWGGDDRVNVLLLGGDGGVNREGIRTDSVMVASMNTGTGDTVLFSLPRNLQEVPFPEGSPLAELYPDGFTGEGDPLEWMLNAVYRNVPAQHPGALGETDNEGADALKLAVSGALGLDVDYYMLVNLAGFEEVVDAIGGVMVNINDPIPIGGNSDLGIAPDDYLEPGPNQHLDGFEALWFARGRYGYDDYHRMERQRCLINAVIDEAEPLNVLRRYEALIRAGEEIVRTDLPQDMLPAFVDLALDVKNAKVRSVVFKSSEQFSPGDPDYDWMHETVQRAIGQGPKRPGPGKGNGAGGNGPDGNGAGGNDTSDDVVQKPKDACAYTADAQD